MSITRTSPAWALPGAIHRPGLAAWNVPVARARDRVAGDLAGGCVDAAGHVAGNHHRAATARLVDRRDRARRGLAGRTCEAGAEDRVDDRRGAVERTGLELPGGAPGRRAQLVAASPWSSSGDPSRMTSTSHPRWRSSRATTNPSPPLLPLPQTTATVPRGASSQTSSVRPEPALSISSSPGIPRSLIAHSSVARCSSAPGSGVSQPGSVTARSRRPRRRAAPWVSDTLTCTPSASARAATAPWRRISGGPSRPSTSTSRKLQA